MVALAGLSRRTGHEAITTGHEDTATRQIRGIRSFTQLGIDAVSKIMRHKGPLITQAEADREGRKPHILSTASKATAPARILLAGAF